MTDAEQIARFLAERGATRCPTRWAAETSNAEAEPPPPPRVTRRGDKHLGDKRRRKWAYQLNNT